MQERTKKPEIDLDEDVFVDPGDDDFGAILNCAVRYALGRRSYMPGVVTAYIRPLLPYLTTKTIACFKNDLERCKNVGDPDIDEPLWKAFLGDVQEEYKRRKPE